jgi:hypothetical protein
MMVCFSLLVGHCHKPVDVFHGLQVFRGQYWEMPDEGDQLLMLVLLAVPARHARKANAVLDNKEELPIRKRLCL